MWQSVEVLVGAAAAQVLIGLPLGYLLVLVSGGGLRK